MAKKSSDQNVGSVPVSPVGEAPRKPEPAAWRYTLRKPAPAYPKGSYVRSSGGLKADNQNG